METEEGQKYKKIEEFIQGRQRRKSSCMLKSYLFKYFQRTLKNISIYSLIFQKVRYIL